MKQKISITIDEKTLKEIDSMIDNIYIRNRSQAIEHLVNNALGENKTAVILAGGKPDSLRISDTEYRPTARIKNTTVIEMQIKKLRENGFKTIYIIAMHKVLTSIFDIIKDGSAFGVKVNYVEDKDSQGTASSLRLLKGKVNSSFLVVYGDIIIEKIKISSLYQDHIKKHSIATLMLTTSSTPSQKGIVKVEGSRILNFVQKPKKTDIYLGFSSLFAAEPELFDYSGRSLEEDIFPKLAEKGLLYGHLSSEKEIHIHKKQDIKKVK